MKGESPENYWNCLQREYQNLRARSKRRGDTGPEAERLWRPRIDPHGNEKLRQVLTNMKALPLWD
jgi:hypothetical protein